MKPIRESGYFWKFYGFTRTHMWGLHVTSGLFAIVAVGLLVGAPLALFLIPEFPNDLFYKLLALSAVIILVDIAMILYSIFSILYFRYARDMSSGDEKRAEQVDADQPTAAVDSTSK